MVIQQISVGGPVYSRIVQGKDLVADILPPPAFVIEAYLEATLAANRVKPVAAAEERIRRAEGVRRAPAILSEASLPEDISKKLLESSDAKVVAMFRAIDQGLIRR